MPPTCFGVLVDTLCVMRWNFVFFVYKFALVMHLTAFSHIAALLKVALFSCLLCKLRSRWFVCFVDGFDM